MTTTAQELDRLPWKLALCKFELWDEILGTEVTMLIVKSTLGRLIDLMRGRFHKTGNIPKDEESGKKFEIIYVLK